jgi:hypothetical protein
MTVTERSERRLQMGRVVVLTSQLIRDNALLFSALTLIITAPPSLFLRYEEFLLGEDQAFSASYLVAIAAYVISAYFLTAAIAKAIILVRTGHHPTITACLEEIARDFYTIAAIAIISSFVWVSGVILSRIYPIALFLLIPGFFIDVVLSVVVPARTIEHTGFVASFARSAILTAGHRWPLLGLVVVMTVISIIYDLLIYGVTANLNLAAFEDSGRAVWLSFFITDALLTVVGAALATVLYFELRLIKEGVAPDTVAAEFD